MKRKQRAPYLALASVTVPWPEPYWDKGMEQSGIRYSYAPSSLCFFCRYARWVGSCSDPELDCEHKLDVISEKAWDVNDCWGFRPSHTVDDVAEWVSQRLQGTMVRMPERELR